MQRQDGTQKFFWFYQGWQRRTARRLIPISVGAWGGAVHVKLVPDSDAFPPIGLWSTQLFWAHCDCRVKSHDVLVMATESYWTSRVAKDQSFPCISQGWHGVSCYLGLFLRNNFICYCCFVLFFSNSLIIYYENNRKTEMFVEADHKCPVWTS